MFPVGLAALDQGYYGAAPSYWKARELEDTNAAYNLLGQTFMQMAGQGQQPTGWGPQVGAGAIPGGQPMPPPGMPPGGVPGAPPGMPRPGMMPPTTPQGTLGSIIPSPAAGPAAIPQPGGMPPAQAPGPTASPGIPQPGSGAGPASPPMGGPGGFQQPPPQIQAQLGQAPYDWRSVAQSIASANPSASPAVIARAVTMMMPFLNQESQQYMRQLNLQLQEQRLMNLERHQGVTEGQGAERLDLTRRGQDIREQRYETLSEQATRRLDQGDQRIINDAKKHMETMAQRAKTLEANMDDKRAKQAREAWQAATNNFHRTMREKIGAAGITDNKTRKQMMEDLDRQQKADQADIDEFYQQMKERSGKAPYKPSAEPPAPPAEKKAQAAPAAPAAAPSQTPQQRINEGFDSAFGGAPAGPQVAGPGGGARPIPKAQLDAIKADLANPKFDKQKYLQHLQEQGFDTSGL